MLLYDHAALGVMDSAGWTELHQVQYISLFCFYLCLHQCLDAVAKSIVTTIWWQHAAAGMLSSFNALTLLVGRQELHPACKGSATTIPKSHCLYNLC